MTTSEVTEADVDAGLRLLAADDSRVLSYLGIQAERLELAEQRAAANKPVPAWSVEDAMAKALDPQRAGPEELARYAEKGLVFAKKAMVALGDQLRGVLCDGKALRKELSELRADTRTLLHGIVTALVGALLSWLPGLLAKAAISIATTIAVLLLKKNLETFCAVGPRAVVD
jgi:hypothetical protein